MANPLVEVKSIEDLLQDPNNTNKHTQRGHGVVENSIRRRGVGRGILAAGKNTDKPVIMAGNLTHEKARDAGIEEVIYVHTTGNQLVVTVRDDLDYTSAEAIALGIEDNEAGKLSYSPDIDLIAQLAADDNGVLALLKKKDKIFGGMLEGITGGQDEIIATDGGVTQEPRKTLAERFGVPPFSVLDARQGYWQNRKRAWIALGIKGELGRDGTYTWASEGAQDETSGKILAAGKRASFEVFKTGAAGELQSGYQKSSAIHDHEWQKDKLGNIQAPQESGGTSIFDPVLCELVYRWFCPVSGSVLDPFAGESTKGIVSEYLKHPYTGVELRPEQVEANEKQAQEINIHPKWIQGDSEKIDSLLPNGAKYDLIFTSPPYYDLEIYSESEKDGSAFETYEKFMIWYKEIFRQTIARLNDNRFLVVKIGEIRDKKTGIYRNFVGDNISCFIDLGLHYYNEIILVTAVGSLPLRVGKQFSSSRKIGKTHQNILVFYKGNPKHMKDNFSSEIEYAELPSEEN